MQTFLTDLEQIRVQISGKETENEAFRQWLQLQEPDWLDQRMAELNSVVEPAIDCLACGNCCRSLMINVSQEELETVSHQLEYSREAFRDKFLEEGSNGMLLVSQIPCHFLNGNSCRIYENRFGGCREFPGLTIPGISKRLFSLFMRYEMCPIVFNVVEMLKRQEWKINNE